MPNVMTKENLQYRLLWDSIQEGVNTVGTTRSSPPSPSVRLIMVLPFTDRTLTVGVDTDTSPEMVETTLTKWQVETRGYSAMTWCIQKSIYTL